MLGAKAMTRRTFVILVLRVVGVLAALWLAMTLSNLIPEYLLVRAYGPDLPYPAHGFGSEPFFALGSGLAIPVVIIAAAVWAKHLVPRMRGPEVEPKRSPIAIAVIVGSVAVLQGATRLSFQGVALLTDPERRASSPLLTHLYGAGRFEVALTVLQLALAVAAVSALLCVALRGEEAGT